MNLHPALAAVARQLVTLAFATSLSAQGIAHDSTVVADTNVAVRMRDGVELRADVWRPKGGGRFPVLVYRTPYGKHQATAAISTARKAVARGYAVVLQDVRGRYASGGEFLPYQQEGRDGFDTIEWAAAQPWSNGSVGTFGLSYPGAVQWLAAVESPPHLKAMVPAMTYASAMMFWYMGGIWDDSWVPWIQANIATDRARRIGDTTLLRVAPWYFEWKRHPPYDGWWEWAELRGKHQRTSAAVLNLSGWHDDPYGPHGATTNFAALVSARGGPARTALVMGPWTHGVGPMARTKSGAREYGRIGVIDYDDVILRWMDRHVRGIENGVDGEKPVRVFVMGSNRWVESDAWPVPGIRQDTIVLTRSGSSSVILSDPHKPVADPFAASGAGAHDYRALAAHPHAVVFDTPPLAEDLTVVGAMRAELTIAADAPDTDVHVKVYDVAPDGTALNLMSPGLDVLRASYRAGRPQRELLEKDQRYALVFNDLLTANTFRRGHRIRLVVLTTFTPHFPPNPHAVPPNASRAARVTVHHGQSHPVRLILPVLPASAMLPAK